MAPFHIVLGMSQHLRDVRALWRKRHSTAGLVSFRPAGRLAFSFEMPAKKRSGPAFTVNFPNELRATRHGEHWWVEVDGRELRLSNLDKVFWPEEGYTKGDLVAYYYNIAPRLHRIPSAAFAVRLHRGARLPVLRPGSVRAGHVPGRAGSGIAGAGGVRSPWAAVLSEDLGRHRRAGVRADHPGVQLRGRPRLRRPGGPDH